jgi:hypothetical protein
MFRRSLFALVAVFAIALACSSKGRNPRFPRRAPGCPLTVYNGLPAGAWDDIGVVEVGCYLDESEIACLGRLRTEACRMGGDIIYNVPKKALRPMERGMIYRAMVAHSRDPKTHDEPHDEATAAPDAGSGPVMLLPKATEPAPALTPPPSPADAGTH